MKTRQFVHSAKTNGSNPIVFSSRVRDALWPASRNSLARSEKSNTQIFLQLNNMNQNIVPLNNAIQSFALNIEKMIIILNDFV